MSSVRGLSAGETSRSLTQIESTSSASKIVDQIEHRLGLDVAARPLAELYPDADFHLARLFFVELFDESALVEFFDEARVDELFGFVLIDVRPGRGDIFVAGLHAFNIGIGRGYAVLGK